MSVWAGKKIPWDVPRCFVPCIHFEEIFDLHMLEIDMEQILFNIGSGLILAYLMLISMLDIALGGVFKPIRPCGVFFIAFTMWIIGRMCGMGI